MQRILKLFNFKELLCPQVFLATQTPPQSLSNIKNAALTPLSQSN